MAIIEMLQTHYREIKKNNFFDAWGIVVNPKTAYALRAEVIEASSCIPLDMGEVDKVFGLVVIPNPMVDEDTAYIVDESFGRQLMSTDYKA